MTKIYSLTRPVAADIVDAFCSLQKGFTDQFVDDDKARACRYMGLGRCIALADARRGRMRSWKVRVGRGQTRSRPKGLLPFDPALQPPVFFSLNRFDGGKPSSTDGLLEAFPPPEVHAAGNRAHRKRTRHALAGELAGPGVRGPHGALHAPDPGSPVPLPHRHPVPAGTRLARRIEAGRGSRVGEGAIGEGRVDKVVLSRRQKLVADSPFPRRTCWSTS